MNTKKILNNTLIILCITIFSNTLYACSSNDNKKDWDAIEEQIKEDIVGNWNAGSAYMCFFENGEVGIFTPSTGKGEIIPYYVDGDVIRLEAASGIVKLSSVEVTEDTLKYISEAGHENTWFSVSAEEVNEMLESTAQ